MGAGLCRLTRHYYVSIYIVPFVRSFETKADFWKGFHIIGKLGMFPIKDCVQWGDIHEMQIYRYIQLTNRDDAEDIEV